MPILFPITGDGPFGSDLLKSGKKSPPPLVSAKASSHIRPQAALPEGQRVPYVIRRHDLSTDILANLLPEIFALVQVVLIDLVLAGDNAVVVGMAAAGVAADQRAKVVFWGVGAAVVMRILLAVGTTQLLGIIGLHLAGGILLLWVAWKMYRELKHCYTPGEENVIADAPNTGPARKSFWAAMTQILIADLSMSLDNVLAVAGAAREHLTVLVIGLLLSVALMGAAATFVANKMAKYRWIAWVGLLVILFVALRMIWHGTGEVGCAGLSQFVCELIPPVAETH